MRYEDDPCQYTGDCHDTLFLRLAQDVENMASELWPFIPEEYAVVLPSDLTRQQFRLTSLFVKNVPA